MLHQQVQDKSQLQSVSKTKLMQIINKSMNPITIRDQTEEVGNISYMASVPKGIQSSEVK